MKEILTIDQPEQIKAMESEARLQMIDWLLTQGPLTARELAAGIGLRRTAIYHHLKILLEAGLVEKSDAADGDLYQAVAVNYRIDRAKRTPRWNEALGNLASTIIRGLMRKFRAAYLNPEVRRSADHRENDVFWTSSTFRLSPDELAEVSVAVQEIVARANRKGAANFRTPEAGKLYTFAVFMVPEEEQGEDASG